MSADTWTRYRDSDIVIGLAISDPEPSDSQTWAPRDE